MSAAAAKPAAAAEVEEEEEEEEEEATSPVTWMAYTLALAWLISYGCFLWVESVPTQLHYRHRPTAWTLDLRACSIHGCVHWPAPTLTLTLTLALTLTSTLTLTLALTRCPPSCRAPGVSTAARRTRSAGRTGRRASSAGPLASGWRRGRCLGTTHPYQAVRARAASAQLRSRRWALPAVESKAHQGSARRAPLARASTGRPHPRQSMPQAAPSATASLGQPATCAALADHTGLASHTGTAP